MDGSAVLAGGCNKFYVNGHLAGNCRPSISDDVHCETHDTTEAECCVDAVGQQSTAVLARRSIYPVVRDYGYPARNLNQTF